MSLQLKLGELGHYVARLRLSGRIQREVIHLEEIRRERARNPFGGISGLSQEDHLARARYEAERLLRLRRISARLGEHIRNRFMRRTGDA